MKYRYTLCLAAAMMAALGNPLSTRADDAAAATPPATPPPPPAVKWESSAAAGLTLTRGNSDTLLTTLAFTTGRKTAQDELSMDIDGSYGETKETSGTAPNKVTHETTTTETLHGFAQYNWLFTPRFYGYGRVEGLHDGVADIRYRVTLSPGAGYYFIKNTNTDLSAEVGPGYVIERLGSNDMNYATLRVGEKFHQSLSDRARLWQTAEWLPQVDKFNNYIINFEIGIEADLSAKKKFSLRTYFDDTYNNQPAPGKLKNDAKLVAAIAYKF